MRNFEGKFTAEDIQKASEVFDQMCVERHEAGAQEYGPVKFLTNDVMAMLAEELLDAANYCRYQFIKIILLNELLQKEMANGNLGGQSDGEFHRFGESEFGQ